MGSKEIVVVLVAPMIEVVPLSTLREKRGELVNRNLAPSQRYGKGLTYGVTVMVNGGGCTELVKMIGTGPSVELELELLGRETPQTLMAVVVTGKGASISELRTPYDV